MITEVHWMQKLQQVNQNKTYNYIHQQNKSKFQNKKDAIAKSDFNFMQRILLALVSNSHLGKKLKEKMFNMTIKEIYH